MKVEKGFLSMISLLSGVIVGAICMNKMMNKRAHEVQNSANKNRELFMMMNQWVRIKQEGKSLSVFLANREYKKIAIYGMGYAGETLLEELKDSNIKVVYGIDRNADGKLFDIKVFSLEDNLPDVDVIVVTAITYFDELEEQLSKKTNTKVISLNDILYQI